MQSLVKCNPLSAFCVTTHNDQFDLHFTSMKEEEPKKWFSYHSRMPMKNDIIAVMKRIGQVPSETLEDNIKLIEESNKTKTELKQVQESNATLTKENEELKSNDTKFDYKKDQEMKVEY